jgi:hypothetical protein
VGDNEAEDLSGIQTKNDIALGDGAGYFSPSFQVYGPKNITVQLVVTKLRLVGYVLDVVDKILYEYRY